MFSVPLEEFRQRFRKMTPEEKAAHEAKMRPPGEHSAVSELVAWVKDKEGREQEVRIDLAERLKYWGGFYRRHNVDGAAPLPEKVKLTAEQKQKMQELMAEGFTQMIIIPENLVDDPQITKDAKGKITAKNPKYARLHAAMSAGYTGTYQGDNYKADGGLEGGQDRTKKFRIILTKDVRNLQDDAQFKATLGKSLADLEQSELKKYSGFSESAYLIYQREYFERTGKHLDEIGWTWLPDSSRPGFGRVSYANWDPASVQLLFSSRDRVYPYDSLGCRLAGSFEISGI